MLSLFYITLLCLQLIGFISLAALVYRIKTGGRSLFLLFFSLKPEAELLLFITAITAQLFLFENHQIPPLLLLLPLLYPLYTLYQCFFGTTPLPDPTQQVKNELIELIKESDTGTTLDAADKQLIASVITFRSRIAREVMIPRVDIFSLPADTKIKEAARRLIEEGYSRIPVYKNTIDEVVGILMYKDLLLKYMEFAADPRKGEILDAPIGTIAKKTLYTPETKKISHLLQDFRKKQLHLSIVVDEYGGTEGIITIEDILEEIVGEIADEYDEDKELFVSLGNGSWIVDTRMSILDAQEDLHIKIPQDADYDTVGGYIYHRAGTIPGRGFTIEQDDFIIEVIKSTERGVEKVRITPKRREER